MLKKSKKPTITIKDGKPEWSLRNSEDRDGDTLEKEKLENEMLIVKISAFVASLTGISEIIMCRVTHSQSILIDGIYDFVEVIFLLVYLFFLPMVYRPYNQKMPYGYAQIETVFVIIKTLGLITATLVILKESIYSIFHGGNVVDGGLVSRFELGIAAVCLLSYLILRHFNGKWNAPMLEAELYSWKLDVFLSIAIAAGYLAESLLQRTSLAWIGPYVDPITAICIAVFMLPEPIRLLKESMSMILLRAPGEETVREIRSIVNRCLELYEYEATFLDIVQTGRNMWVYVYVKSRDGVFRVSELKKHNEEVSAELKKSYENIDVELIPDVNS